MLRRLWQPCFAGWRQTGVLILATYWTCRIKPRLSVWLRCCLRLCTKYTVDVTSLLHVCNLLHAAYTSQDMALLLLCVYMPLSSAAVLPVGMTQDILPWPWTLYPWRLATAGPAVSCMLVPLHSYSGLPGAHASRQGAAISRSRLRILHLQQLVYQAPAQGRLLLL